MSRRRIRSAPAARPTNPLIDELLGNSARFRVSGTVLTLYDANWTRLAAYSQTQ
ncbi:MAG TPA: hypothetical protein VGD71_06095 [Kribbella sp.]